MNAEKDSSPLAERYGAWVVRHRWFVLAVSLAIGMLFASGAAQLGFIDEYRVFFGPDNPQLPSFDEVEAIYTKNDNILIVVETPDNDAFSRRTLEVVEEITAEAWKIPFAIRVDSLTNFQHTYAEGEDDLIVEDLVTEANGLSAEQLAQKKVIALREPQVLNRMVTRDADVVGINVTLQLPRKEADETARAVAFARELGARIEAENPGFGVRMTGMVMLNNAFQESAMNDMATLTPLMYVVIILVMAVLLRSVSGTLATVSVIGLSVTSGLGLAGWAGLSLTPPSTASITMIMTLAVADSIHVLVSMIQEMRRGRSKREAITESLRINSHPVFLTSITTVIGFLSMNFSEVPPLRNLGNIAATGVAAAWFYSMTFLPAVISILPLKVKQREKQAAPALVDSLAEFVIRKRKVLLAGGGVTALALAGMLPLNDLNDQFVDYFDHSTFSCCRDSVNGPSSRRTAAQVYPSRSTTATLPSIPEGVEATSTLQPVGLTHSGRPTSASTSSAARAATHVFFRLISATEEQSSAPTTTSSTKPAWIFRSPKVAGCGNSKPSTAMARATAS